MIKTKLTKIDYKAINENLDTSIMSNALIIADREYSSMISEATVDNIVDILKYKEAKDYKKVFTDAIKFM